MRPTGLAHDEGAVYRQLKKVFLNLLSGVLEAHQSWLEIYKPVSLPCVWRLCSPWVKGQKAAWHRPPVYSPQQMPAILMQGPSR